MGVRYSFPAMALLAVFCIALGSRDAAAAQPTKAGTNEAKPVIKQRTRSLDTTIPPPESPVYEVDPGTRLGHFWTSGYWDWDGKKHVWQSGRWIKERPGHVWVASTWAQRGDKWRLYPGHWEKDAAETEEEVTAEAEAEPAPAPAHTAKAKPAKRKLRKPIDYTDTKRWPRVIQR